MTQTAEAVLLLVLGAVVSFMTARYWQLQSGAAKEAERLAQQHHLLEQRVTQLELHHALLAQRVHLRRRRSRTS